MNKNIKGKAIIIGAGPAGLTAAYELLKQTSIKPVILEATDQIGGISRTARFKDNRIDIGVASVKYDIDKTNPTDRWKSLTYEAKQSFNNVLKGMFQYCNRFLECRKNELCGWYCCAECGKGKSSTELQYRIRSLHL